MKRTLPSHLQVTDGTPGRLLSIGELACGDSVSQSVTFTPELLDAFGRLAQDGAAVHADPAFAAARGFEGPIVQGLCVTSRFSRLLGMYLPGERAVVESLSFKFRKPVYRGATVDYTATVVRLQAALRVVRLQLTASVRGGVCVTGECQCVLR